MSRSSSSWRIRTSRRDRCCCGTTASTCSALPVSHKESSISRILSTYPNLKFVLIGDSGEEDPEIYSEVVRRWPERVRVIYIRSVRSDPSRLAAVDRLIAEVRRTGCQLVLAPDSEFAAVHAAGEGLIAPAALARIRREKAADEGMGLKPRRRGGFASWKLPGRRLSYPSYAQCL